jgi:hypothetical protein
VTTYFADVSHYQAVDLPAYFRAHDRIALKVTEATGYVDPTFPARYAYCRAHGHPAVLYHFDRARFSGSEQFDWFLSHLRAAGGPRPFPLDLFCLDSEDTNFPTGSVDAARAFTARAVALGFDQGSVYSGAWFAEPYGLGASAVPPGWRRLWLSDYGGGADGSIRVPRGWTRDQIVARQFTNGSNATRVNIPGVGPADYNRVLSEWVDEEPDMNADQDRKLNYIYTQIAGAVGAGQTDFRGTMSATLSTVQGLVNLINSRSAGLGASISDTKSAALAAIATIPAAHLDDRQVAAIAEQVAILIAPVLQDGDELTADEVASALRHVFAVAGTEPAHTG